MPLSCDCHPGCWGDHSQDWPKVTVNTDLEMTLLRLHIINNPDYPYGSYVTAGKELRLETDALFKKLAGYRATLKSSLFDKFRIVTPEVLELLRAKSEGVRVPKKRYGSVMFDPADEGGGP